VKPDEKCLPFGISSTIPILVTFMINGTTGIGFTVEAAPSLVLVFDGVLVG
jgi:hypothetical protein